MGAHEMTNKPRVIVLAQQANHNRTTTTHGSYLFARISPLQPKKTLNNKSALRYEKTRNRFMSNLD